MPLYPNNTNIITNFDPLPSSNLAPQLSLGNSLAFYYPNTSQTIASQTQTITLPNYNTLLGNNLYTEYRIFASSFPSPSQISIASSIDANGSIVQSGALTFTDTITYQNLDGALLPTNALLVHTRQYTLKGKRIDTEEFEDVATVSRNYSVQYVFAGQIYINPTQANIAYVKDVQARPSITVNIYTLEDYVLLVNSKFTITGSNLPTPTNFLGSLAYGFTEPVQVTLTPNDNAELNLDQLFENEIFITAWLPQDNVFAPLRGNLFVASTAEFLFQPQSLNFMVILGSANPTPQNLQVYGGGSFAITAPSWLQLSQNSGTGLADIEVSVISQELLEPGTFQNNITITANGISYTVPVTMHVVNQFELNLSLSGLNFTDQNTEYTYIYNNSVQPRYILAYITIPQIGYPNALALPKTYQYRLGFFNNRTKIHLGEIVKRALKHITANEVFNLFQDYIVNNNIAASLIQYYIPSLVQARFELLSESTNQLINQAQYNLIRFIAGRKPLYKENLAILDFKRVTQKVTQQSVRMVNFSTARNVVMETYINGEADIASVLTINTERLYGKMISFANYSIGDVIEVRLHPVDLTPVLSRTQRIFFIVYPEPKQFNQIIYIDEYRVPQFFDFCGDWSFTTENELIQSTTYTNLIDALANEKSIENHSLIINTGYIPADHDAILEQIKRSRHCWLLGNQAEKLVELVPKAYNMVNYDSDLDLYQYTVEFTINPTNDLQNYS